MKRLLALLLAAALMMTLLAGCEEQTPTTTVDPGISAEVQDPADMFTDRDQKEDYSTASSVVIQLSGDTATASSSSVQISGSTITLTEETTYIITGTLNDGQIVVNADENAKLQIVLDGAQIHSETSAALYILGADKVVLTLAEGTENTLSNGGTFEAVDENNIDAALFSKQDLSINGAGSLTVTSPVGHGIVCKDDLVLLGGNIDIASASHGLDVNDSVRIGGTTVLGIVAGKDGIHCENEEDATLGFIYVENGTLTVQAEGDGISAGAYLQVEGGVFDLTAGGGSENGTQASSGNYGGFMPGRPGQSFPGSSTSTGDSTSMKGLKAEGDVLLNGGSFTINSADDAIHANGSAAIAGGTYALQSGDDAVHAENTLTVTACTMTISESYEGLEAHKIYVQGGDITIHASDDGINAAGGTDSSGTTGGRDGMFGGGHMGGGGGMSAGDGVIDISGGVVTIHSSGDGMDANGTLTISGGQISVYNPTSGDTSVLDADYTPVITGGTFISAGSTTMMAQTFSTDSTQGVIACTVGNQKAGSVVTVTDAEGNVIVSYELLYNSVLVIISTPDIEKGVTYHMTIGETSGSIDAV